MARGAGTTLVKPFPVDCLPPLLEMKALGNLLFFTAADAAHGHELWATDGSTAGTALVRDINPGDGDSISDWNWFAGVEGTLFWPAGDGTHGIELWAMDTEPCSACLEYATYLPLVMMQSAR